MIGGRFNRQPIPREIGLAALEAALCVPLAVLLALLLRGIVERGLYPATDLAAALMAVSLLALPGAIAQRPLRGIAWACGSAGAIALALPALFGASQVGAESLVLGGLTVSAMTLAVGGLAWLLLPLAGTPSGAIGWVLAAGLALAAAPLWLAGPIDRGAPLANALIAVNPLTALSLPAGLDYPRADWIYRRSPLGSLRYDYPSAGSLILAYLALGGGALALAGLVQDIALPKRLSPRTSPRPARADFPIRTKRSLNRPTVKELLP